MDSKQVVDAKQFAVNYSLAKGSSFASADVPVLRAALEKVPAKDQDLVYGVSLKNSIIVLVLSFCFGGLGVDRFYLGDYILGTLKLIFSLLTIFINLVIPPIGFLFILVAFVWWLIDIFLCYRRAKQVNIRRVLAVVNNIN